MSDRKVVLEYEAYKKIQKKAALFWWKKERTGLSEYILEYEQNAWEVLAILPGVIKKNVEKCSNNL